MKESESFEGELLVVPVNFLLFGGASIGDASNDRVEGGMLVMRGISSDSSKVSMWDIWMATVECSSKRGYTAQELTFNCGGIAERGPICGRRAGAHFESVILELGDRCASSEPESSYVVRISQNAL